MQPIPKLEFLDDFPSSKEEEIRKLIQPMLRIVGRDMDSLNFRINSDPDVGAEISVMRRYHTAHIYLSHAFFFEKKEVKKKILLHELTHVLVDKVQKHGVQMIDAYFEEGSSEHSLIRVRFEESAEELTDALALAFLDILDELEELRTEILLEAKTLIDGFDEKE